MSLKGGRVLSNIKILELSLRNFKGIRDFMITPGGEDLNIYGDNATGKTSIMDAFLWLLFDKDSSNSSNFNVKTLDKLGKPINMLEHEVIAKLDIDGKEIELQKIYKEKWTKKRGQADSELTGHTTEYFINGVPKNQTEYKEYLKQIVNEDTFKILTNPLFFNRSLDWKSRRKIALDLCEELSMGNIIDQDNKLVELKDLLIDKTIDDLKAEMTSRRKKLNEELKSIPYRIDELSRENIEIDVERLTTEKKALEEKLKELKNSKPIDYEFRLRGIRGTISMLENEIKDLERKLSEEIRVDLDNANKAKYNLEKSVNESGSKAFKLSSKANGLVELIEKTEKEKEELREQFLNVRVTEFKEESTICPTCQQELQAEKVEALIKDFEENQRDKLRQINEAGKQKAQRLEKAQKELEEIETELSGIKEGLEITREMLDGKKKEVAEYEKNIENIDITKLPKYQENIKVIKKLEKEKLEVERLRGEQDHTESIRELENQVLEINKDLAKVDLAKENKKRVKDLMNREKELAQMVAETEKTEFLCDQFVITKSNLLEDNLNSKFKIVKFKLFDVQVNGGINETFVTTVDGVPFEDLNNAMKINAGLDIITTLSEQYGLVAPIFLDNRESVNAIPNIDAQIINLIVSKDKKLRVEVEK